MVVCDTGPLVSALNAGEGARHRFALDVLETFPGLVVVPWPVYAETDLLLRRRGRPREAIVLGRALLRGEQALEAPTPGELGAALDLLDRYGDLGIDLPDATVMAMADARRAPILTWDFRHFRAVVFRRGETLPLLVNESELPGSQP